MWIWTSNSIKRLIVKNKGITAILVL